MVKNLLQDLTPPILRKAAKRLRRTKLVGKVSIWDYDCVLVMEFLEHVEKDLEVLRKIKPGTRVLATVPNFTATGHVRSFDNAYSVFSRRIKQTDNKMS